MPLKENKITVESLEWFYREAHPMNATDKPPVVLLHGLPSQSYTWTAVMPDLAENQFRAIAPDWIGFGFSAQPEKRDFAYTPEAFIQAFTDFVNALELEKFSLVVQGFLGSVGIQYALRHRGRIERLAILNAPISTEAKLPWKLQQLGLPLIGEMLTQDPLLVDRTLEGGSRYPISERDLDVYRRPFLQSSTAGRSLMNTVRNLQLSESMAEIESGWKGWLQPTLLVWGLSDPWLNVNQAQNLANSLPNGELVKLEAAGHYPQEHWSEKVSNALLPFLRRKALN